jgi:holo-[acyl-carrier protein] synthase
VGKEEVKGIGVDIVEIGRLDRALVRWGERFTEKIFTSAELEYSMRFRRPAQHLSARFAAKEAVVKALGQGFREGCRMCDVEVVTESTGRPGVRLHGAMRRLAERRGVENVFLSLSHSGETAVAQAVAVGSAGKVEENNAI